MDGRLKGKVAIVVGAGSTPGDTMGNGRATAILFAREGAKVMLADKRLDSAEETKAMIDAEGGESFAFGADVTSSDDCKRMADACAERVDPGRNADAGSGEKTQKYDRQRQLGGADEEAGTRRHRHCHQRRRQDADIELLQRLDVGHRPSQKVGTLHLEGVGRGQRL